jgi:hypothetical protein
MRAGPPCFANKADACAVDPSRASQYKLIPADKLAQYSLSKDACVCKSKICWRVFGMADEPKKSGSPSSAMKQAREECSTAVFNVSSALRSKPAVVVKIHSIKDARCFACPRCHHNSRCADCCALTVC